MKDYSLMRFYEKMIFKENSILIARANSIREG
jgi:hypothetical protein